jgi:hypothetical protein
MYRQKEFKDGHKNLKPCMHSLSLIPKAMGVPYIFNDISITFSFSFLIKKN